MGKSGSNNPPFCLYVNVFLFLTWKDHYAIYGVFDWQHFSAHCVPFETDVIPEILSLIMWLRESASPLSLQFVAMSPRFAFCFDGCRLSWCLIIVLASWWHCFLQFFFSELTSLLGILVTFLLFLCKLMPFNSFAFSICLQEINWKRKNDKGRKRSSHILNALEILSADH